MGRRASKICAVTLFDLGVVLALIGAVVSGWRRGVIEPVARWAGMAAAGVAAIRNTGPLADLAERVGIGRNGSSIVASVLVCVVLGGLVGSLAARAVLALAAPVPGLRSLDRAAGSAVGAIGVVFVVWLVAPVSALLPGGLARTVSEGATTELAQRTLPAPPDLFEPVRSVAASLGVLDGDGTDPGKATRGEDTRGQGTRGEGADASNPAGR